MTLVALRLVAYIMHPPWAKWLQRFLFVLIYSLIVATGYRGIASDVGVSFLALDGWLLVLAGLVSTGGALGRLYNIESIGLYLAVAGLAGGAWWSAVSGAWYTAYVVVAVAGLFGLRLLSLNRIDAAMRAEHHLTNGGP
jgi:hypothetical protein